MPDIKFKTRDEIPESLRDHAKEVDGGFAVGVVHESFRDRNVALLKERDALKVRSDSYGTIVGEDPEKFVSDLATLREMEQQVKDGKLTKKGEIDQMVNDRVKAKQDSMDAGLKAEATKRAEAETRAASYESKFKGMVVETAIIAAVTSADSGANPSALPDILNRARAVFSAKEDGTLVAKRGDGIWYGADGENAIQPKEWVTGLLKEAPYLGKTSNGAGGSGSEGKGRGGLSDEAWNKLAPEQRIAQHRAAGGR